MQRPQKIFVLWTKLLRVPYQVPDRKRDARTKQAITNNLRRLRDQAKPELTEESPAGQRYLLQRDRTGVMMRNYCRTLRNITNKKFFKQVKGLTAVVMSLALRSLDD